MIIRQMNDDDIKKLKETYKKFYSKHFEFPDFSKFFGSYVVIDTNSNEIITAGGVRPIAESVLITDKSKSNFKRVKALYEMLEYQKHICKENNLDQLHAFVGNSKWKKHLINIGFKNCKGDALYLDV